jgi:DNA repair exonuclease SbcCD ATPase subunit
VIEKLAVRGYQSLSDIELELGRVTVITGPSDSGKSALIRALEDAAFNTGSPDILTVLDQIRAPQATVEFGLDDGVKLLWSRTAKTSGYVLDQTGKGGASETFTKMNKAVPENVSDALGIREVQIDSGSGPTSWARLQFVGQFDQPFLVVDRGGVAAARILGRLTGIHIFAEASKLARQEGLEIAERRRNLDEQIAGAQQEADALASVEAEIAELERLAAIVANTRLTVAQYQQIDRTVQQYRAADEKIAAIGYNPDERIVEIEGLKPQFQTLWVLAGKADKLTEAIQRATSTADRLAQLEKAAAVSLPDAKPLWDAASKMEELDRAVVRYTRNEQTFLLKQTEHEKADRDVAMLKQSVDQIDAEIPLCPFRQQFAQQRGLYRCRDLMKVIDEPSG